MASLGNTQRRVRRLTISDEIIWRLIGLIIDEGFQPGAKLPPERGLMVRRGAGRSSLREAIRSLVPPGTSRFRSARAPT